MDIPLGLPVRITEMRQINSIFTVFLGPNFGFAPIISLKLEVRVIVILDYVV